jgi:hypothetical protein
MRDEIAVPKMRVTMRRDSVERGFHFSSLIPYPYLLWFLKSDNSH